VTKEKKRIVVADDDPHLRSLLVDTLLAVGYEAEGVRCGSDVLEVLARERVDVVISDIAMPRMDGFELAGILRREYPQIKIVFMTGVATRESQKRAAEGQLCDGYLPKPFRIDRIEEMIESILGPGEAPKTGEAEKPRRRVLIVDDDPRFLDAMVDSVSAMGYTAFGVRDANAAMSAMQEEPAGVVIADVSMPQMNGFDLLKLLKRSYPRVPVVMMTGHNLSEPAAALIRDSADAYLTKPFRHEAVRQLLQKLQAGGA
jgi:DNA-binding NtrC family response regulator